MSLAASDRRTKNVGTPLPGCPLLLHQILVVIVTQRPMSRVHNLPPSQLPHRKLVILSGAEGSVSPRKRRVPLKTGFAHTPVHQIKNERKYPLVFYLVGEAGLEPARPQ